MLPAKQSDQDLWSFMKLHNHCISLDHTNGPNNQEGPNIDN